MATGLLIDPVTRTITLVEVGSIATALRCCYIDRVELIPGEDLWIDDEGRCQYPHPEGYFKICGTVMCGRGLVLGERLGESVDTRETADTLLNNVEWIDTPPQEDVEPGFAITTWGAE